MLLPQFTTFFFQRGTFILKDLRYPKASEALSAEGTGPGAPTASGRGLAPLPKRRPAVRGGGGGGGGGLGRADEGGKEKRGDRREQEEASANVRVLWQLRFNGSTQPGRHWQLAICRHPDFLLV